MDVTTIIVVTLLGVSMVLLIGAQVYWHFAIRRWSRAVDEYLRATSGRGA